MSSPKHIKRSTSFWHERHKKQNRYIPCGHTAWAHSRMWVRLPNCRTKNGAAAIIATNRDTGSVRQNGKNFNPAGGVCRCLVLGRKSIPVSGWAEKAHNGTMIGVIVRSWGNAQIPHRLVVCSKKKRRRENDKKVSLHTHQGSACGTVRFILQTHSLFSTILFMWVTTEAANKRAMTKRSVRISFSIHTSKLAKLIFWQSKKINRPRQWKERAKLRASSSLFSKCSEVKCQLNRQA